MPLSLAAVLSVATGAEDIYDAMIDIVDGSGTGNGWTFESGGIQITENGSYFISGDGVQTANRIRVKTGVTASVTLDNVNISVALPFEVAGTANVTVILKDGSTNIFAGGGGHAGIRVQPTATLTITTAGQILGDGSLSAYGGADSSSSWATAGIGGSELEASGTIVIDGGTVFAKGGDGRTPGAWRGAGAAGIGGANGSPCGNITINGGTVTAIGGNVNPEGAGIGGGSSDPSRYEGKITINGGTVRAYSGQAGGGGTGIGFCSSIAIADTADVQAYSSGSHPAVYGTAAESGHSAFLLSFMLPSSFLSDNEIKITQNGNAGDTFKLLLPTGYKNLASTVKTSNGYGADFSDGSKKIVSTSGEETYFPGICDAPNTALSSLNVGLKVLPFFDISRGPVTIEDGTDDGTYKITYGASETADNILHSELITLTGSGNNGITVSAAACTVKIRLDGVAVNSPDCALALTNGSKADITLSGSNSLTSGSNRAGLEVPAGTELTISGTDDDMLTAQGGAYAAGIGGGFSVTPAQAGTITIKGGIIEATGGEYIIYNNTGSGAGIGGGRGGDAGELTIEGGAVTATGGYRAAGIGGGFSGTGGTVLIKGGDVTATGGSCSAGIGGGFSRPMGSVTIEGGTVNASAGTESGGGAGIGGGYITSNLTATHTGGWVLISGGDVTATGCGASGIGSGGYQYIDQVMPVSVTITGGTVNAAGTSNGAGIGSSGGTVTIEGGTVTAAGGEYSAGIGGRYRESGGTIVISGGDITAIGGVSLGGAGIGGGWAHDDYPLDGGIISISGGTITATGSAYGADIGGGYKIGAGTITITGGNINTTGGGLTGIGQGFLGSSGSIVISRANLNILKNNTVYNYHAFNAGSPGTIHIGFTGEPDAPVYDPVADRATVTVNGSLLNESGLIFGTCLIVGDGAGELAGSYIEGIKQSVDAEFRLLPESTFEIDVIRHFLICSVDKLTEEAMLSQFENENIVIVKDGEQLEDGKFVGTGCEIRLMDGENILESLTVIIKGDVDGDGKTTVSDARKVLRVAVELENFNNNPAAAFASDADENNKTGVPDARKILRVAVGLESF